AEGRGREASACAAALPDKARTETGHPGLLSVDPCAVTATPDPAKTWAGTAWCGLTVQMSGRLPACWLASAGTRRARPGTREEAGGVRTAWAVRSAQDTTLAQQVRGGSRTPSSVSSAAPAALRCG